MSNAGYNVVVTRPNGAVQDGFHAGPKGRAGDDNQAANVVQAVFGPNIKMNMTMSNTAGTLRGGRPHASTGIPYAMSGSASVVNVDVADRLSSFSDPIKALLGTGIHEDQKIIIRRQYIANSAADIVPERAPARTVALQEDVREVMLTRYGADIEWNMNLLGRPADFQREMNMKVSAQQEALRAALVRIGYDVLMSEGTDLIKALVNSNPLYTTDAAAARLHAERIYVSSCFGAMAKHSYPVENLLSAARHASTLSTIANAEKTVLILPIGLPELHTYTKPDQMM